MFLRKSKDLLDVKTQNIFRIQEDNSTMCGYFWIGFTDFMFAGRSLIDFTGLFPPYDFKQNDKKILIILNELKWLKKRIYVYHVSFF